MEKLTPDNSNDSLLTDWSKWLITISIGAASGCAVVLKVSEAASIQKTGIYLFSAILLFAISILCASLFVLRWALSAHNKAGDALRYSWMLTLQWTLFAGAIVFVLIWIAKLALLF